MSKRIKIFLLYISFVLVLTSCVSTSTNEEKGHGIKRIRNGVKITEEEARKQDEKMMEKLKYYKDIDSAIENNSTGYEIRLKKTLKTIENDDKIIIYGVVAYDKGFEKFSVLPLLKKKDEDTGEVLYSEPWINFAHDYSGYELEGIDLDKGNHAYFQILNFGVRNDITIPEKKNFQFFLLKTKGKAESIKVNGHKPDGIIEHEVVDQDLNKQKSYFVYFNDIEMSGGFDDMEITFDQ